MDPRITADLLYESEATLRLVDTALDEIRAGDQDPDLSFPKILQETFAAESPDEAASEMPSEFRIRTYWQVREVADCIRESRELLRTVREPADYGLAVADESTRFDRVLSLIDRLDSESNSNLAAVDPAHFGALRADIMAIIGRAEASDEAARNISLAISFLSEAEGRLTRLGHVFDAND